MYGWSNAIRALPKILTSWFLFVEIQMIWPNIQAPVTAQKNLRVDDLNRGQILGVLKQNPQATRNELSRLLKKSPNTIKEHIARLKDEGRLKRIGSDRSGYWEVQDW
jgi:predicted HTH transcriptional regulator